MRAKGYSIPDSVSGLIDSLAGRTVIVACNAQGVFEEVASALDSDLLATIFAVNDVGVYLPRVDHWVSYHCRKLEHWNATKIADGVERRWTLHTGGTRGAWADFNWYGLEPTTFPLSGQLAFQIAYLMGAERIILCGCPMDSTPRFFEPQGRPDQFRYGQGATQSDRSVIETMDREFKRLPEMKAKIRSMSGWSREYFGGLEDGRFNGKHSDILSSVADAG